MTLVYSALKCTERYRQTRYTYLRLYVFFISFFRFENLLLSDRVSRATNAQLNRYLIEYSVELNNLAILKINKKKPNDVAADQS